MSLKKVVVLTAAAGALGGLIGCSEGDQTTITIEGDTVNNTSGTTNTGNSTVSQNCPEFASARNRDADGNDVCALPSQISSSLILTKDIVWYMDGRITVGNGNLEMSSEGVLAATGAAVQNVTLTIEAGTELKAKTGSNTSLLITRGSKIMAEGTAAAPIIFSSDDAGYDGSSEWGGLVISGYAPQNECPTDPADMCNVDGEAEAGFIGGHSPNDNSGVLKYVIVTEGGFEILPGDEINGISLAAVGDGTVIDYVQVNGNSDDGIEFYGGTVNAKHLVLTGNDDDSVDWDEAFQGNLQYVIVKQAANPGGNGIEADTFGQTSPLSKPVVANATFIGGAGGSDLIHRMKKGTGGFIVNSILTGNGGASSCISVSDDAKGNINTALVYENVILDCAYDATLGFVGPLFEESAALDSNYASQSANAQLGAATDWTVFNGTYSESTADTGFLEQTDYIGAVDPNAATPWFAGWVLPGTL